MVALPGDPVLAQIARSPSGGGQYVPVLDVILRRWKIGIDPSSPGILFQPEQGFLFSTMVTGADEVQRHRCFADWPDGANDPIPVHPGDQLIVPLDRPVQTVVLSSPVPTRSSIAVPKGKASGLVAFQPFMIGSQRALMRYWRPSGDATPDVVTLDAQLASLPVSGQTVTQDTLAYPIDTCDAYQGHHLEILVRLTPGNVR